MLLRSPKNRRREEFVAQGGGGSIHLGHYKHKEAHPSLHFDQSLSMHANVTAETQLALPPKGLSETKFGKGFYRRPQEEIKSYFNTEERRIEQQYQQLKAMKQEQVAVQRKDFLKHQDARSGYNIITGQVTNPAAIRPQTTGMRMIPEKGLGSEAPIRGKTTLRESEGRFFMPQGSGHNFEYRQQVLYKEGLLRDKYCSLLQIGKSDMKSYGVEEQFSKSEYTKNNEITRTGLYEYRMPGKFTPRKLPGHPSGNSEIVSKWTTDIDLNNRAISPNKKN